LPIAQGLPILAALTQHAGDENDPFMPLLLWWSVETHASVDSTAVVESLDRPEIWRSPLARHEVLPRLMRRLAAEGETGLALAARLATGAPDDEARVDLFEALGEALIGPPLDNPPGKLLALMNSLWEDETTRARLASVALRLGHATARDWVRERALDTGAPENDRIQAIELLAAVGGREVVSPLLAIALNDAGSNVRVAAMRGLVRFDDPQIRDAAITNYADLDPSLQSAAREVLFGRADWALTFLRGVEGGHFSPADMPTEELARLALHERDDLDELIQKHWGRIGAATAEERLADVRRLNNDLRAASGDPATGRLLFRENCGKCHTLFGEGTQLGPDLTTANRQDRQYLLTSIVDPSTVVRKEHMSFVVATTDGRILTGMLVEETPSSVTLLDAENRRHTVIRGEIDSLEPSTTSLMPERLLEKLSPQALRDLFAYLQTTAPP